MLRHTPYQPFMLPEDLIIWVTSSGLSHCLTWCHRWAETPRGCGYRPDIPPPGGTCANAGGGIEFWKEILTHQYFLGPLDVREGYSLLSSQSLRIKSIGCPMSPSASKVVRSFFPFFCQAVSDTKSSSLPLLPFLRKGRTQTNKYLLCPQIFAGCYGGNITRGGSISYIQRPSDLVAGTMYILKLLENKN